VSTDGRLETRRAVRLVSDDGTAALRNYGALRPQIQGREEDVLQVGT
jgi:hypothetical protein